MAPTIQISVRLDEQNLQAVDGWRRANEDPPSRPEAMRKLIEIGLSAGHPSEQPIAAAGAPAGSNTAINLDPHTVEMVELWRAKQPSKPDFTTAVETAVLRWIENEIPDKLISKINTLEATTEQLIEKGIDVVEGEEQRLLLEEEIPEHLRSKLDSLGYTVEQAIEIAISRIEVTNQVQKASEESEQGSRHMPWKGKPQ